MYLRHAVAKDWIAPLIAGLAYYAAAMVSLRLTQGSNGIATMWPSGGILLAALLLAPRRRIAAHIMTAATASMAANFQMGNFGFANLCFTLANMIESLIAAAILSRGSRAIPSFISLQDLGQFCFASIVAVCCSTAIAALTSGSITSAFSIAWWATDLLGILIVTPMILTTVAAFQARATPETMVRTGSLVATVALLVMVATITAGVFAQNVYPLLFVPLVALLAATCWLGPFGAAAGVLLVAVIGSTLTALGHGPLVLIHMGSLQAALFLQFYLLALFATALPLAGLLAARQTLMRDCAESERLHRLLADRSGDIIGRFTLDGIPLYLSPACRTILGYAPEDLIGKRRFGAIHPDDRAHVAAVWQSAVNGTVEPISIYRRRRIDGDYAWLEATYRLAYDPSSGIPAEMVATIRDVSERRTAECAVEEAHLRMRESHRLLSMAERAAHVGHWRLGAERRSLFWSPEVYRIHGIEPNVTITTDDAVSFYHPDDRDRIDGIVKAALAAGTGFEFEARLIRADDAVRHVVSRGQAETAADGTLVGLFGVIQDVTRQVQVERQLEGARAMAEQAAAHATLMADSDALTGLASRRKALRDLDEAIVEARASGRPLSVAIFDIDHFKAINDQYGHGVGDAVLRHVGQAAATAVRTADSIGRIGGEEFLVILPGADSQLGLTIAERLRAAIEAHTSAAPGLPGVTTSVGVASLRADETAATLLGNADRALYAAKAAGRNKLRLAA